MGAALPELPFVRPLSEVRAIVEAKLFPGMSADRRWELCSTCPLRECAPQSSACLCRQFRNQRDRKYDKNRKSRTKRDPQKHIERCRAYYAECGDVIRAVNKAYYHENRPAVLAQKAAWRAKNKAKIAEKNRLYREKNKVELNAKRQARRRAQQAKNQQAPEGQIA